VSSSNGGVAWDLEGADLEIEAAVALHGLENHPMVTVIQPAIRAQPGLTDETFPVGKRHAATQGHIPSQSSLLIHESRCSSVCTQLAGAPGAFKTILGAKQARGGSRGTEDSHAHEIYLLPRCQCLTPGRRELT
jgi:hypothetical protein